MADTVLPKPHLRWRDHWLTRATIGVVVVLVVLVGASVASALSVPGSDSLAARAAEWGRGHGLSGVIDALERTTYQAPTAGGRVAAGSPLTKVGAARSPAGLPPSGLPPISALARPAVRGEGVWRVVAAVGARPALQVAFVRPDAVHTSYTAGIAWMDTSLLRLVLHPGTQEPGGGRGRNPRSSPPPNARMCWVRSTAGSGWMRPAAGSCWVGAPLGCCGTELPRW